MYWIDINYISHYWSWSGKLAKHCLVGASTSPTPLCSDPMRDPFFGGHCAFVPAPGLNISSTPSFQKPSDMTRTLVPCPLPVPADPSVCHPPPPTWVCAQDSSLARTLEALIIHRGLTHEPSTRTDLFCIGSKTIVHYNVFHWLQE